MSETFTDHPGSADVPAASTGHPVVDAVLDSLVGLESRPVAEHVAVFEVAHDRLRAALAETDGDSSPVGA